MIGHRSLKFILFLIIAFCIMLSGCGGSSESNTATDGDNSGSTRRGAAVATMPAAQFESVGAQSRITETVVTTVTEEVVEEGPDLALGERVYTNRCAECHGAQAEGGSAVALRGTSLPEAEFIDWLRTGGEIGNDHLFGTRVVSENGIGAMYAYLQSLE